MDYKFFTHKKIFIKSKECLNIAKIKCVRNQPSRKKKALNPQFEGKKIKKSIRFKILSYVI